jgi:hypothetical protein
MISGKGFLPNSRPRLHPHICPVAKWDSLHTILSLATKYDWELHHLDVKAAYLNTNFEEEHYLKKPGIVGKGYWKLLKGLYSLCQSG